MNPVELSLENQFELAKFKQAIERMSEAQAKETLGRLMEYHLASEQTYKQLLKSSLVGSPTVFVFPLQ